MNENITKLTDVIHGTIYLSEIETEIISTPLFNRLHYVSQTSTVYLTYPSNNSKRFDHSIGTMKLCGDIFYYGIVNSCSEVIESFIKDLKKAVKSRLKTWKGKMPTYFKNAYGDESLAKGFLDIDTLDFMGGLYKQYTPSNISKENWNYYILIFEAIRVCGLLHDIGHPPFSHIVETGLTNAYNFANDNSSLKRALKTILSKKNELHEEVGNVIFMGICHSIFNSISATSLDYKFFYILVLELANEILEEKTKFFKDIHRIIAGSLDGDRLDNINRDSFMTGFDKNAIIYNQLINSITLIGGSKEGYEFCPDIKTLTTVEECFLKRWKNYRCMTHHHKVIKTNYMLQMIVYYMSLDYCNQEKNNDDEQQSIYLPYDISGLWKPILETNSNKMQIIRFIQWNDNWLMTVLQKKYLDMFLHASEKEKTSQLYYFLEEIIESKKNYKSLIKRYEDYVPVDNAFKENFSEYFKKASDKYNEFNKKIKRTATISTMPSSNITEFIKSFINIDLNKNSFATSQIAYLVSCFIPRANLFESIGENIRLDFFSLHGDIIEDCFLVSKKLKIGTDNLLCMYDSKTCNKKRFIDLSHVDDTLKLEQSYIPEFYMYIKYKKDVDIKNEVLQTLKKDIGKIAAKHVINFIDNNFMKYLHDCTNIV